MTSSLKLRAVTPDHAGTSKTPHVVVTVRVRMESARSSPVAMRPGGSARMRARTSGHMPGTGAQRPRHGLPRYTMQTSTLRMFPPHGMQQRRSHACYRHAPMGR